MSEHDETITDIHNPNESEPGDAPHSDIELGTVAEEVTVYPAEGKMAETSQALLDAAESLELNPNVVMVSDGNFVVPKEVADAATLPEGDTIDEADDEANDGDESYTSWKVAELETEIDARNEGREDDAKISKTGNKADLVAALEADDEANPE